MANPADSTSLQYLRALSYRFPSIESALSEIAHLKAVLTLPKGTVHIVSDVHGENKKLGHILRNASGGLRPLVAKTFEGRLSAEDQVTLLNLIYYPRETFARQAVSLGVEQQAALVRDTIARESELIRLLASRYTLRHARRLFPSPHEELFTELLFSPLLVRDAHHLDALLAPFIAEDGGVELLRLVSRTLRDFSVFELVVAGDLGDRGPRIDRVIELLRMHRNVHITWGNHDAEWMGACLGQEALIATVLRVSLRYGRIAQLEEGYGIPVEPIEQLARAAYAEDPAEHFRAKGEDLRDPLLLARMQKAMTVLQLKLEGQTIQRNPSFGMDDRNLLHRIDTAAGTVTIDGKVYPLLDDRFPTIDRDDPYRLSPDEARCIERMKQAFFDSAALWRDMRFVLEQGSMLLTRDEHLVFHGCVPVDETGEFLSYEVDGVARRGKELFEAIETVVRRAFRERKQKDLDLLYYLWAGARSPLFGKDRMATFETYFVADKATHKETKNAYFKLIHEVDFCRKIATELGGDPETSLIVNGHVPVKLEESPLKKSGRAVTIDGAFSEAYGDKGYTLVLEADRTFLAQHHHFESIEDAIVRGADIIPTIQDIRVYPQIRRVGETVRGDELRAEIAGLERLVRAYREHEVLPPST
jgi:fructose-1,6-bisphosphatase-3